MTDSQDSLAEGIVPKSALVVCMSGRCSFALEGEHHELAKSGAIILRRGQKVTSLTHSEDFSATCFEVPAPLLASEPGSHESEFPDRRSELFERFKNLLDIHYNKEHDSFFYAKQLRITQKYLAFICKDLSGLSVKEWIDQRLMRDARFMLSYTDKTISQISASLHFKSPELFGKFFKRMSSLSPRQFRASILMQQKTI